MRACHIEFSEKPDSGLIKESLCQGQDISGHHASLAGQRSEGLSRLCASSRRVIPSVRETALLTALKWQDMGASAVEKGNPNGELSSTLNAARAAGDLDLAVVGSRCL